MYSRANKYGKLFCGCGIASPLFAYIRGCRFLVTPTLEELPITIEFVSDFPYILMHCHTL